MAGRDPVEFRAYEDEFYSIVGGILVDAALFSVAVAGAAGFVLTGSMAALVVGLLMGNVWARDVGNRPDKERW